MKTKNVNDILQQLKKGNIASLASAITLVESEALHDQTQADELLKNIFNISSNSYRIGVSGAPGVGKSTFINKLGMSFIEAGHKVAVLAIDPSSEVTHGSILGDKTRMEELSRDMNSFIRPSASRGFLGGVHPSTRDTIRLCEAAGYDVIIVETVGVGQSETAVSNVVDYLLLLAAPGAGDELQGIKRGLLEKIDAVVVNKADASNKLAAQLTEKQFQSALSILRDKKIPTLLVSSLEKTGVSDVLALLQTSWSKDKLELANKRREQDQAWLEKYIQQIAFLSIREQLVTSKEYASIQKDVLQGKIDVRTAAKKVLGTLTFV